MMQLNELRAAVYHRLHLLLPFVSPPAARKAWRLALWFGGIVYFVFIGLALVLRYSILPNIEDYRGDIERMASQALSQSVTIGRIDASWRGINPDLALQDVRILDGQGRPALAFSRVEAVLSWWSVPSATLKLRLLRIEQPTLNLRRDAQGQLYVAGIPLNQAQNDNDMSDWVLAQRRIRIENATIIWDDDLRQAPTLELKAVNFALDNDWRRHRFGLTAVPPEAMASKIDFRGEFRGNELDRLDSWTGKTYAEVDYADLAVWRQWVDYPFALPHGRGAVRAWADVEDGSLREITADLALREVNLRLAADLPALDLEHLSGRLGVRLEDGGFDVHGSRVELATRLPHGRRNEASEAPIKIAPTDFRVQWQPGDGAQAGVGSASANHLDLATLARLADYLPFDAQSRQWLNDYAPQGQVSGLAAKWKGDAERLGSYSLKAAFSELALNAQGYFPGFTGLTGVIDADEKGGSVNLRSKTSSIDLPTVFPESQIALDSLNVQAKWKVSRGVLDAELMRAEFSGPDAAGTAQGKYRNTGEGPGTIDMTAALTRADARAVWRYMPGVVNANARHWLRDSLLAGDASEAKLILKGDLSHFPFLDKSQGQFLVTVKARDVTVDYGTGWPKITGIFGDLRFEGAGMTVDAERGQILGAALSRTRVVIPDFDAPVSMLYVNGGASGPTGEFLKFIDQSPVAERIDRFTEDMRASGDGRLDLKLEIPLDSAQLDQSKVEGVYHFLNNDVTVDSALPPIRQTNGSIRFSGSDLHIPEITGSLFGGPLKIHGGLQKDGKVLISAAGTINAAQLRKQSDAPIVAGLSGSTAYRGEVRVNRRNADIVIDSSLAGLGLSLPEPFRKAASENMPLRFEKKTLPPTPGRRGDKRDAAVRDQITASLGNVATLQIFRRKAVDDGFAVERGAIAVGQPLTLPERGLALNAAVKQLDLDAWRRLLQSPDTTDAKSAGKGGGSAAPASPSLQPDVINLRAPAMLLFGKRYNDVDMSIAPQPNVWKIRMNSRQATGDLSWESAGSGKLTARFKHLAIEAPESGSDSDPGGAIKTLPALDVIADDFSLGTRRFGRLELSARNEGGLWRLNRIQASNPAATLSGSGEWRTVGGRNQTSLNFKIDASDAGRLLERFGFPGTVRNGTAQLEGRLSWNGAPVALDYASLNGEMKLDAAKGQFVKLDPGRAGKLIGLISLQSLPRRIFLDFKDVFSEGFSFDSIASKVDLHNGVMQTERLQIDGPSARIVMRGEVDLKHETQQLAVNVQPDLGSSAALGIALVNPIAGVATLLAHKVLQNPLNQMFGFDYRVTGTWDDPKVEKLSNAQVPAGSRLPNANSTSGGASESPSK